MDAKDELILQLAEHLCRASEELGRVAERRSKRAVADFERVVIGDCTLLCGDALAVLRTLPDGMARCCVTSPPYFGLRDYGHPDQIGLEPTPEQYVASLVAVFAEVRRVLADDGTLWLNLGDSYNNAGSSRNGEGLDGSRRGGATGPDGELGYQKRDTRRAWRDIGIKHKDLLGIPWSVAFALRADGWYLRSDIIWSKPSPMPESVTDRPTKAHEYLFLLAKSERYYYDAAAIAERCFESNAERPRMGQGPNTEYAQKRSRRDSFKRDNSIRAELVIPGQAEVAHRPNRKENDYDVSTRNKRTVWTVATTPYSEAHFATFPPKLIEPCILAGSAKGDTVLDPFSGTATTGLVAEKHGRKFVGIELNPKYIALAKKRLRKNKYPETAVENFEGELEPGGLFAATP